MGCMARTLSARQSSPTELEDKPFQRALYGDAATLPTNPPKLVYAKIALQTEGWDRRCSYIITERDKRRAVGVTVCPAPSGYGRSLFVQPHFSPPPNEPAKVNDLQRSSNTHPL